MNSIRLMSVPFSLLHIATFRILHLQHYVLMQTLTTVQAYFGRFFFFTNIPSNELHFNKLHGIVTKGILICDLFYYYYLGAKHHDHVLILYMVLVTVFSLERVSI